MPTQTLRTAPGTWELLHLDLGGAEEPRASRLGQGLDRARRNGYHSFEWSTREKPECAVSSRSSRQDRSNRPEVSPFLAQEPLSKGANFGVVDASEPLGKAKAEGTTDVAEQRAEHQGDRPRRNRVRSFDGQHEERAGKPVCFRRASATVKLLDGAENRWGGEPDDVRDHEGSSLLSPRTNGTTLATPSIIPSTRNTGASST